MNPHSVKLGVTPCLRLECKFWLGDDGWNGIIESLGLTVHAPDFQTAKSDMEIALGKYIEALLAGSGQSAAAHAA
jgi:hypothetical protein